MSLLLLQAAAPPVTPPFFAVETANTSRRASAIADNNGLNWLPLQQFPFVAPDLPGLLRRHKGAASTDAAFNLLESTLSQAPFVQWNWSFAVRRAAGSQDAWGATPLVLLLPVPTPQPFGQLDWACAQRGHYLVAPDLIPNLLLTTLLPGPPVGMVAPVIPLGLSLIRLGGMRF